MVLHNSKWDRKAKKQYMKKHGIEGPKPPKPQEGAKLGSNSWRFDENTNEANALKEQERIAQVNDLVNGSDDVDSIATGLDSDDAQLSGDEGTHEHDNKKMTPIGVDGQVLGAHTLGQAATRAEPVFHNRAVLNFFPESKDKLREMEEQEHYASIVRNIETKPLVEHEKKSKSSAIQNPESFFKYQQGIDRARMASDLKTKFKASRSTKAPAVDAPDDDFDKFLDELDTAANAPKPSAATKTTAIAQPNADDQSFLDDLLG